MATELLFILFYLFQSHRVSASPYSHQDPCLAADTYWNSEHHRMTYADNVPVLLNLDRTSLHALAIAEPGTYTKPLDADNKPQLAWRPHRRDSEFEEVHVSCQWGLWLPLADMNALNFYCCKCCSGIPFMSLTNRNRIMFTIPKMRCFVLLLAGCCFVVFRKLHVNCT